jgi:two-component system response regulator NreC
MIRTVLVDDHAVVRTGLRLVLQAGGDIVVVGEAATASAAESLVRTAQPDVILLDLTLPDESGMELLPRLLSEAPEARALVLSVHSDPSYVREAFAQGAHGYVPKEASDADLVDAVRDIARGASYIHPSLANRLVRCEMTAPAGGGHDALSERELEVLRLLALGHTNQELAATLHISTRTAEMHRAHILQKLGFTTRAELVRYAIAHGLLGD